MVPCWRQRARDGLVQDKHSALAHMYNYIDFVCLSSLSASSSCSRAWWFCTTWVTSCREVLRLRKTAKHRADHVLNFSRLFIFRLLSSTKKVFVFTDTVGIVMRQSENYILSNKKTAEGYWSAEGSGSWKLYQRLSLKKSVFFPSSSRRRPEVSN